MISSGVPPICGHGLCGLSVALGVASTVSRLPGFWRLIAQAGVQPGAVVVVDPGEGRLPGMGSGCELVAVDEFAFQGGLERLGDGVVPADHDAPDRLHHPETAYLATVVAGHVLAAAAP